MRWLAERIVRRPVAWFTVLGVLALVVLSASGASRLEQDEDILAFLPQDNPEVRLFYDINERFGGTDVALVGIEVDDPFDAEFLTGLREATARLDDLSSLDHVLSLANVIDFTPDEELGGIVTAPLVAELPATEAEAAALRAKVMSRDHIVGSLISEDAGAVLILCYLSYGANPRVVAREIRTIVTRELPNHHAYWGGGPFISTYIYDTTQADLRRLTPWAVIVIVLIMLLVFRDVLGTSLVLLSTAFGIVITLGLMAAAGVAFNILLSSTPVVLFAIGSAYGLHILARYYSYDADEDPAGAIRSVLTSTGPVVMAAGLTTAVSLLSFVCMDIAPLRIFGVFTALGILITLFLSLTFIPAALRVSGLKRRPRATLAAGRITATFAALARSHRVPVAATLAILAVAFGAAAARVDTSVDMTTFFSPGSPPDRAATFLRERFGGSQFVQVNVGGDMNDPDVLRKVRQVADEAMLLADVAATTHIGEAVALSNNAMVGQLRIPDTEPQLRMLYAFVGSDPSIGQLITPDRRQALIHVKVGSERSEDLERVIDGVGAIAHRTSGAFVRQAATETAARNLLLDQVTARVIAVATHFGVQRSPELVSRLRESLSRRPAQPNSAMVSAGAVVFLRSSECAVEVQELGTPDPAPDIAGAAVALGPDFSDEMLEKTIAKVLVRPPDDPDVLDLAVSFSVPLAELWAKQRAREHAQRLVREVPLARPTGDKGHRFINALATALLDLDLPRVLVPAKGTSATVPVAMQVNGLPVMHQGLARSVTRNQFLSLGFALALVLVIMTVLFRSFVSGLLGVVPTALTILIVYGGMGLFGVHLDIGTSMLAGIIMGAGVDYAVHLLSAWRAPAGDLDAAATEAARRTGPAIWTNAIMIAAGFLVLTMGEARPLQNVGSLTAAAMMVAALATFMALPALGRRGRYRSNRDNPNEAAAASAVGGQPIPGSPGKDG